MAGNVKRKYTNFFEGVMDVVSSVNKAVDDFEKGIVNSIAGMVTGLLTVVKDAGVVAVSGVVPDPVEPSWLKESAGETVDAYTQAALQFLQDPIRAVESTTQVFTDTVESEGVMYVTGATIPALIPGSLAVKGASGVAKLGAGAARRAPKLLDSKPFSGNYYRKKIEAAKAGMAKVTEKFTFGKDYALSTGGANFKLRDKDFAEGTTPQMLKIQNGREERVETKGINVVKDIPKINVDDIPTAKSGNFNKFFNSLTISELDEFWKDKKIRKKIERQLRAPGGLHEWHLVSRAPQFKYWNIGAEEIKELRTAISDVKFVNPNGVHGGLGSTKAHNELLAIIDTSSDYNTFVRRLNNWANYRLEGGVSSLPEGLRLK
ncbi:hypothetical protein [Virgibacillus dokdonensis]